MKTQGKSNQPWLVNPQAIPDSFPRAHKTRKAVHSLIVWPADLFYGTFTQYLVAHRFAYLAKHFLGDSLWPIR